MASKTFQEVLAEAVAYFAENGFSSEERLDEWVRLLRDAARGSLPPVWQDERVLRRSLEAVLARETGGAAVARRHSGIGRFTVDRLRPQLRQELERRISLSANLIKLNRDEAVEKTLRRFSGWASSVPAGGSGAVRRADVKKDVAGALRSLSYVERRVAIDQGHKLASSVNELVARGGGAIAVIWHSHWRQAGYDYRPDHKERDGQVYLLKGNWASEKGLVKPGPAGWYEDVTAFGQEVFCRCFGQYIYAIGRLPAEMLTDLGKAEIERVRAQIRSMRAA